MRILGLGEKIKILRKQKNMTLKELAGDRVTPAQISHIERDKSHTSYELLEYLSERLDVSIDYLLETKEMQSKKIVETLVYKSEAFFKIGKIEEAKTSIKTALEICEEYNLVEFYGRCNFLLGDINASINENNQAILNYEKALQFFIKANDLCNISECYISIGEIFLNTELYDIAIIKFNLAKEILENTNLFDIQLQKELYSKLAFCYMKSQNYSEAFRYIEIIENIDKEESRKQEIDTMLLKANNLFNLGNFEESKKYLKDVIDLLDENKNDNRLAKVYLIIAEIFNEMEQPLKVLEYAQKVYDIKKNEKDEYMEKGLILIIESYISIKDFDLAKIKCKVGLIYAIKTSNKLFECKILRLYAKIYKCKEENSLAIEYLQKAIDVAKRLNNKKVLLHLYDDLLKLYSGKSEEIEIYKELIGIYKSLDKI